MKIKKSILSIMLAMALVISSFVPSVAFADAASNSAAITRLAQLGMVDETLTDPNSIFTRAQLAKAVALAKDLTDEAATLSGSTIFPDIESNSELSGYVNSLLSRGLMYGRPDGYFHPEGGVTYAEACIVLVKLLGYTDSDVTGMWPNNYISKATDLKLNSGITLKKNDYITVSTAAIMIDRLLDTNMKNTSTTQASKTFSESVNLYTDIVVYDTALTYSTLANNAVLTDKGTYYLEDAASKLQAGNTYRVVLEDNNIEKVYGKTKETLSVTVDNIIDNVVSYKDNNISKSIVLPSDIIYYYHGTKQGYDKLSDNLKTNTTIIFAYNDNKTGFEYAIIADPVYSKPVIVENFSEATNKFGDITFDNNVKVIKNGLVISKSEIEEFDVIYSITDLNGSNKLIYVYNNRAEGNIKAFSPNGPVPTSIKIDNSSYNFSKEMDLTQISKFKIGDKISAILGYDGKVVGLKNIDYHTMNEVEIRVLGNSKTSSDLIENQILTDKGKYYVLDSINTFELGGKYTVNVDDNIIVKSNRIDNSLDTYGVRDITSDSITYASGDGVGIFQFPRLFTYYYNGQKIDYKAALDSLKLGSSVILAKNKSSYEYGVIIDPIYSKPIIKNEKNVEEIDRMFSDGSLFVYRNGDYYDTTKYISDKDVVYTVSDIWNTNKYVYAINTRITGKINSIAPNKINPKSIQIEKETYSFSKYFNFDKLDKMNVGYYVAITLDVEGKVLDIDFN
jgi:hypothetical protein